MKKKLCPQCQEEKNVSGFCKDKGKKDGLHIYCNSCKAEIGKKYYLENKQKVDIRNKATRTAVKLEVFKKYGENCQCCGENRVEFLSIDHINGGGAQERKQLGIAGGNRFYYWLRNNKYPDGYRVLCYNCNLSLGFHGYCPHNTPSNTER